MDREIKLREALFEIYEAIRQKSELPHELPPDNHFRFDLAFPTGTPIKMDVHTMGNEETDSYFVACSCGPYRTREKTDENLDDAIDLAIWDLLLQKFTNDDRPKTPFEYR